MKSPLIENFQFSHFTVDPNSNLLVQGGEQKRLEPKLMNLLCLMAANAGQTLTREEIEGVIWPGVIVTNESLTRAIFALRNSLGDEAKSPRFIETIPKKGYKFLATVDLASTETASNADSFAWLWSSVVTVFCIAIVAYFVVSRVDSSVVDPLANEAISITPITHMVGTETDVAIDSEGRRLAFVSRSGSEADVHIKVLGESTSLAVTNDSWHESDVQWLDENTLIYLRYSEGKRQIARIRLNEEPEVLYQTSTHIDNLSVGGRHLWFSEYIHNDLREVYSLDMLSGQLTKLREQLPDLPNLAARPVYDELGKRLFFSELTENGETLRSIDMKRASLIEGGIVFRFISDMQYLENSHLLVTGSYEGVKGVWHVDFRQEKPHLLLRSTGADDIISAKYNSHDNSVYYENLQFNTDVMIKPVANNSGDHLPKVNSSAREHSAVFSARGESIFFVSDRSGFSELWHYDILSTKLTQLTRLKATRFSRPVISYNNKYIAVQYEKELRKLAIIAIETGEIVQEKSIAGHVFPLGWSRDGLHLYISEHNESINLYRYPLATLEAQLFQANAGLYARESQSGEYIVYMDYQKNSFVERNVESGVVRELHSIDDVERLMPGQVSIVEGEQGVTVYGAQVLVRDTMADQQSFSLAPDSWVTDISRDGNTALLNRTKPASGNIMKAAF